MGLFRKTLKTYNLRNVTFEKVGKGIFSKLFSRKYKIVEIDGKEAKPTNDLYDAADLRGDFYRKIGRAHV